MESEKNQSRLSLVLVMASAALAAAAPSLAATYYVAPGGGASNPGTQAQPFHTMARAQTAAQPGDTVFFRGGEYLFSGSTIGITLDKSGAPGKPIHYFAYPGETPVFNFKGLTGRVKGMVVSGDWLHLKGIEMKEVQQTASMRAKENWCIYVDGGNDNIFERLNLHHNMGPGYFHVDGSRNLVLNCDSHNNYDAYSYTDGSLNPGENADGFGSHARNTASVGNVFRGCRAWWNGDDGWDFIHSWSVVVTENCWAWNNGLKAGTNTAAGNGNGFKVGGYDLTASMPNPLPQHIVRNSLAFLNRAAGFYQNHHPRPNIYHNNTAFNNGVNYNLLGEGTSGMAVMRNNISLGTRHLSNNSGSAVDVANNSWSLPVTVTAEDFLSVDTSGVSGPRQADGSLPNLDFMKLKPGSDLVDKGVNVGLPFLGAAPDLGAFEFGQGPVVGIRSRERPGPATAPRSYRFPGPGGYDLRGRMEQGARKPYPPRLPKE